MLEGIRFQSEMQLIQNVGQNYVIRSDARQQNESNFPEAECLLDYHIMRLSLLLPSCMPQFPCL